MNEEVGRRLDSDGGEMFVVGAMYEGRLTGTAGFYREKGLKTRHKGRIGGVSVRPGLRGVGIGKKMLQMVLERAAEMDGLEQVLLSVAAMQTLAFRLYRSLGFEVVGCEPGALRIGGRFIDEQYLILRLKNRGLFSKGPNLAGKNDKAPSTFQSRTPRQPSPRTAKPRVG